MPKETRSSSILVDSATEGHAFAGLKTNVSASRPETAALTLMVVEDDEPVLKACSEVARSVGFEVFATGEADRAREHVSTHAPDIILMDLKMPGGGLSLLRDIRVERPRSSVVVMTAYATVASAVEAMRIGATDYLTKPFAMDELIQVLERAGRARTTELEAHLVKGKLKSQGAAAVIGTSPEMEKLVRIVKKVAVANHPVLILGESGSGKETVARAIHGSGPLHARRFAMLECMQLSPSVLEGAIFGQRGTTSGANEHDAGILVAKEGGTLFLDEISEMPLDLQAKLLRALQDKFVRDPAAGTVHPVTVRILASSTRNLSTLVEQGHFRKDLYYRLNVVSLRIPPLRERGQDILMLAEYFLQRARRERGIPYRFAPDALQIINQYEWPGNVRELESSIERACTLSSGHVLHMGDLPTQMQQVQASVAGPATVRVDERAEEADSGIPVPRNSQTIVSIAELEREAIIHTIRQLNGDKLMAAKLLGIGKTTLYRKLKEYGISDV